MQVQVPRPQEFPNEVEKAFVPDFLAEEVYQDLVCQLIEAGLYVSLDEPVGSDPVDPLFA